MELPAEIRDAMVAHARFGYPEEACGLLAADPGGRLQMAYCLTNAARSTVSFTVDPTEHLRALQHAERRGWSLAGVFHSHPRSEAVPSPTDVACALEPEWVHVLVSLEDPGDPAVRAFWIKDGKITEEPLVEPGGGM